MSRYVYNLSKELVGKRYNKLIDFALGECRFFLLVDSNNDFLSQKGKNVFDMLKPYLIKKEMRSEWPGTRMLGGECPVYFYQFLPKSAEIIKKTAAGLYQWQLPELPEDLCFLRPDGSPWLVTIAHENDGYLELTADEKKSLSRSIPGIATILKRYKLVEKNIDWIGNGNQ